MKPSQRTTRLLNFLFIAVAIIGLAFIVAEIDQIGATVHQAAWDALPGALLATMLSYTAMGVSFALVGRLFDVGMGQRDLALVGFITNVINHVVTAGGVAGYSLRYLLMRRHGVPFKDVFAVSAIHFYLTSLDMMVMLPVSALYLMSHAQVARQFAWPLGFLTVIVAALAVLITLLIIAPTWRQPLLRLVGRLAMRFGGRDLGTTLDQLDVTMIRGVAVIRRSPGQLLLIMGLTSLDWLGGVFVLGFCLNAFGAPVSLGVVIAGFVIGIMSGLASMIPGGFGVQEGSMTGVFTLLGVPFGQAVLAAVLFRAIYYFLPYLFSLGLSRWILGLGQVREVTAVESG